MREDEDRVDGSKADATRRRLAKPSPSTQEQVLMMQPLVFAARSRSSFSAHAEREAVDDVDVEVRVVARRLVAEPVGQGRHVE